jgi:hypothetical protein
VRNYLNTNDNRQRFALATFQGKIQQKTPFSGRFCRFLSQYNQFLFFAGGLSGFLKN